MRLCHGPLRGMFDAPTSTGEEVWDAPVICLDISRCAAASSASDLALAITMVCATAFLDARRIAARPPGRQGRAGAGEDDPRQRRGMARAADRGARRLLPGRVQARPRDRRAALDGAPPPLRPRRRRRRGHPPAGTRQGPPRRDRHRDRLPPAPRGDPPRHRKPSASPAPRPQRIAPLPARRRAVARSAAAPTRSATSAPSASAQLTATDAAMAEREPQEPPTAHGTRCRTTLDARRPPRHQRRSRTLLSWRRRHARSSCSPRSRCSPWRRCSSRWQDPPCAGARAPRASPPAASSRSCTSREPNPGRVTLGVHHGRLVAARAARVGAGRRPLAVGQDDRPGRARAAGMAGPRPRDVDQERRRARHPRRARRARRGPGVRPDRLDAACRTPPWSPITAATHMGGRAAHRRAAARCRRARPRAAPPTRRSGAPPARASSPRCCWPPPTAS